MYLYIYYYLSPPARESGACRPLKDQSQSTEGDCADEDIEACAELGPNSRTLGLF